MKTKSTLLLCAVLGFLCQLYGGEIFHSMDRDTKSATINLNDYGTTVIDELLVWAQTGIYYNSNPDNNSGLSGGDSVTVGSFTVSGYGSGASDDHFGALIRITKIRKSGSTWIADSVTLQGFSKNAPATSTNVSFGTGSIYISAISDGTGGESATNEVFASITPGVATNTPPSLAFESASVAGSTINGAGWAADPDQGAPVTRVEVYLDGARQSDATLGGGRPDVAASFGRSDYTNSGWSFSLSGVGGGNHTVRVVAVDNAGATVDASKTVTVSYPPQMAFDSVSSSGSTINGTGWSADPDQGAPVTRVEVYLDGTRKSDATLGGARSDVATAFGRSDYTNSGWSFSIAGASEGTHTVRVVTVDNAGLTVEESKNVTISHSWSNYDNAGAWDDGAWSAWAPAWDPAAHYLNESQAQSRSRTPQRWHDRGRTCSICGTNEDLGTDGYEFGTPVTENRTLWGTVNRAPTVAMSVGASGGVGGGAETSTSCENGATLAIATVGSDADGNFIGVHVWHQYNGGTWELVQTANTTDYTIKNYTISGEGTHVFLARSWDSTGAESATAVVNVTATHVHSWNNFDNAGAWEDGAWSAWNPAWDPAAHYLNESQAQSRSRTPQRWHDRGRTCSICGANEDLGTDGYEFGTPVTENRTLWGTVNRAPTLAVTMPASITYGDTAPIQVSAADADGNLRYITVHVSKWSDDKATMLTGWRLIRPGDLINDTNWSLPDAITNAVGIIMSAGNGATDVANLATTRNWVPDQGPGQYRFHIRSKDALNGEGFQEVWMAVADPTPNNISVSVGSSFYVNDPIPMTVRSTDLGGNLVYHHIVVSHSSFTSNNWEGSDTSGWKWHHFMSIAAANGTDSTVAFNLRDDNYGLGTSLPPGTYHVTLNAQDSVPKYTYDASRIMATFNVVNRAPSVSITGPSSVYKGDSITIRATGTDPDKNLTGIRIYLNGNPHRFEGFPTIQGNGAGAYLDSHTQIADLPGTTYTFTAVANDGYQDSVVATHTVVVANRPPNKATISADKTAIIVGEAITFTVSGSDPDGNLTQINLDVTSPINGFFQINAGPYTFDGNPPNNGGYGFAACASMSQSCKVTFTKPGTYLFRGAIGDAGNWTGDQYSDTITITVIGDNRPTISITADKTFINPGESVSLTSTATDPDGDLTGHNFDWRTPAGDWRWNIGNGGATSPTDPENYFSDRSSNNRSVTFTPNQEGSYLVQFAGRDKHDTSWVGSSQLTITVNRVPTITASIPASITYGDTAPIQVSATDADGNLRYITVHVSKWSDDKATMLTGWRLIRPGDLINDTNWSLPDAITNAVGIIMSAGNGATNVASLSTTRNWTPDQGAGLYRFHIRSIDSLNRASFQELWMTVGKANQAALAVTASPATIARDETSTLSISGGSGVGAVTYSCTSGGTISGNIFTATDLSGSVTITATKAADANYNAATATTTVTIAIPVSASVILDQTTALAPATVQAIWSTAGATSVTVTGPGGFTSTTVTGTQSFSGLGEGLHTVTVTAQGFRGPVTKTASVAVGAANTAPSLALNRIAGGGAIQPGYYTYAGDTIAVQAVVTDVDANLDRIEWAIDGGTPTVVPLTGHSASPAVIAALKEGTNVVVATVFDATGASKSQTFSITVVQPTTTVTIEAQAVPKANMSAWLEKSPKSTATKTVQRIRGLIQ